MANTIPQLSQLCQRAVLTYRDQHSNECWRRDWMLIFFSPCTVPKVHKLCSVPLSLTSSKLPADINLYAFHLHPYSVFSPCLQPQNKPKQNYQRSHGLGTKCWMCWIESFEVYWALRRKCHHWNLSLIFTPSSLWPHVPCPSCRSSMQAAVG